jgi:hypothetical protein
MGDTVVQALLALLDAKKVVDKEEKKGHMSTYWDDTYGFGNSSMHKRLREYENILAGLLDTGLK